MNLGFRFGIITGIGVALYVLLEYALGFHTTQLEIGKYSGYGASLIPIITIFFALKTQRAKTGLLSFREGIQIGFTIAFTAAVITTIFFYFYNSYINPGWMHIAAELEKQKMIAEGAAQENVEKYMQQVQTMTKPWVQAISGFIGSTTMGVIITLIEAAILKKAK
jgi:hypothetical protein